MEKKTVASPRQSPIRGLPRNNDCSLLDEGSVSAIVVIDEHDESLHEERAPTWNASEVATERARLAGVPIVLTSAVPSLAALVSWVDKTIHVDSAHGWPKIEIVDLASVPVAGSLLSTELLTSISAPGTTTACVLNTKGKAR